MAYANHYKILFKNVQGDTVTIYILEKDYSDTAVIELEGSGSPLVIENQSGDEDVLTSIRGSVAKIQYWNKGGYPLTTFASTADDKFKVEIYVDSIIGGNQLYWTGFLVQDDCTEPFLPAPNVVSLQATDNLALLKETSIKDALVDVPEIVYTFSGDITSNHVLIGADTISWDDAGCPDLEAGDVVIVSGTSFAGSYSISGYTQLGTTNFINPGLPLVDAVEAGTITVKRTVSIFDKVKLSTYLHAALVQTGLDLPVNIFVNVFENNMNDRSDDPVNEPFSQVRVSGKTFISSPNEYDNAYDVLDKILAAWKCTLFQGKGEWFIVRWVELRQFGNEIPGTRYDSDLLNPTAITFDSIRELGKGFPIYPVNATHTKSIIRPNKHTKLTFNYEQPYQLIINADFQQLGNLITSYPSGSNTIYEYEMAYWDAGFVWTGGGGGLLTSDLTRFIRVIKDSTGTEIERYGVIKGATAVDSWAGAASQPFYANEGDVISLSFQAKTSKSQTGSLNMIMSLLLLDPDNPITPQSTDNRYLADNGTWNFTRNFTYNIPPGDNSNTWHSVSVESVRIPHDGLFYFMMGQWCFSAGSSDETHWKDIQITYTSYVNETTQVIGHIHKSVQNEVVKKTYENTIFVDDAPKNEYRGVMFLLDGTKTTEWHRGTTSEGQKFGYIQKTDLLFVTDSFRNKIEGDFNNLRDNSSYLFSLLNVFTFPDILSGYYFILGQCRFDMKRCEFSGTLEEIWNTAEEYDASDYENTFTYIYRTQ